MMNVQRAARVLLIGGLAGLATLALDELAAVLTLGFPVPPFALVVVGYAACGVLAAVVLAGLQAVRRRPSWGFGHLLAATVAALYAPAVCERFFSALVHRLPLAAVVTGALAATAGYGLWTWVLARLAPPAAKPFALFAAAASAAAGLAVNRNVVVRPFEPAALLADAAILLAALALVAAARRFGPAITAAVLAAGTAAAAAFVLTAAPTPPAVPAPDGGERPLNLVLVVVDTLRQDVFQAVVDETEEGRAFRDALDDAAWFTQAIAAAPWTAPSVGSILSGLYPEEHGFGAVDRSEPDFKVAPLAGSVPTLAERLAAQGWLTVAIGANPLLHPTTGIGRGFASYEILSGATTKLPLATALASVGLLTADSYQPADQVRRRLAGRLGRLAGQGRPLFLWLQLMDPHLPLRPHRGLSDDPAAAGLDEERRLYRDEARFALRELARTFELLKRYDLWEPTLLVVVSDHGEVFPADGYDKLEWVRALELPPEERPRHGHVLYGALTRVALVVRPPGGLPERREVDVLTSHVDLHDTVIDVLGLDLPRIGRDRVSLAPWLAREPGGDLPAGRGEALVGGVQYGPQWRALRTPWAKLVEHRDPATRELYLLGTDPGERHDLAAADPETAARLGRRLEELWSGLLPAPEGEGLELDEDTRKRLRALGYL